MTAAPSRALLFLCAFLAHTQAQESPASYALDDFGRVPKIDLHFHMEASDAELIEASADAQFRFLNIVVDSQGPLALRARHRTAFILHRAHPQRVAVASAFSLEGWDDADWVEKTLAHLDHTFEQGAVAVKVWKNIGMSHRDADGQLVKIDHPQFDPIFRHLMERNIVVVGHLGEPRNCWLPLEEMTVKNDRNYFAKNPQYHMALHPEMPSYEDQIAARDRMLAKHPDLRFIGAHLASLEWSVDRLAAFLDRFPKASADTAARIGQLQHQSQQDREKVRQFLIRYQDRIVYGTDRGTRPDAPSGTTYEGTLETWKSHWRYFATGETQTVPELDGPVPGLDLPRTVIDKIFRENARKLLPESWK